MISPARAHFIRHSAAHAAAAVGDEISPNASVYELMLAKLAEDQRKLKAIQSVERKIALKAELLPEYIPYVQGVLEGGKGRQDDVLVSVMVWRTDVRDWSGALDIAAYALAHEMVMPDHYHRTLATVVVEEIADQALQMTQQKEPLDLEALLRAEQLTEPYDMPDQVKAKLQKALGYALLDKAEAEGRSKEALQAALDKLLRAIELDAKAGVKKDIERLEREIKNKVMMRTW